MDPGAGIFLGFFYRLREAGLMVTPDQWMTFARGLELGLHGSSLSGFYSLARAIFAGDESELDTFDQAFAAHFEGGPAFSSKIENDIARWLKEPIPPLDIPGTIAPLDNVDVAELRRQFLERLAEQSEKHDGGSKWVGTGGTSPFGHSGYHPGGIRVGGEGRHGTAVQVAAERRFKAHRRDLQLDTRSFGVALKRLRALKREGVPVELDVEGTVHATAKEAGELQLIFHPPRVNNLTVILAMDVGGSMEPYRRLVDLLFSAAHQSGHFKRFEHFYFHNCIYENVYADALFTEPVPLKEIFRRFDRETRLILVGDAHMYPGELTQPYGAVNWEDHNEQPGHRYLSALDDHFRHTAWLNPLARRSWSAPSIRIVRSLFEMYPLTLEGVSRLAEDLAG